MLPARLEEYRDEADPHFYGGAQMATNRQPGRLSTGLLRPRDAGAQGGSWRNILLDQLRGRRSLGGGI